MKILVLGDIHGHNTWKEIIEKETPDKIIFLGDYFDSFNKKLTSKIQVDNFEEIIKLKEIYKDNVIICIGNHDYSYMSNQQCSGYNGITQAILLDRLNKLYFDDNIIVPYHIEDNIIFSHAGVSKTWLKEILYHEGDIKDYNLNDDDKKLYLFHSLEYNSFYGFNPYGDTISQGPLWIRPNSLLQDKIDNYTQVVGHTHFNIVTNKDNVWFCDTLPKSYLIIENNQFIIKNYEK